MQMFYDFVFFLRYLIIEKDHKFENKLSFDNSIREMIYFRHIFFTILDEV